jgi:hypothetical protein
VSVHFGLTAGLQLLSVSFFSIALQSNEFSNCIVRVSVEGGNAYGGAVSLHIGAYSSVYSTNGDAVAAVGDTVVRNVTVSMDTARFESCGAIRESNEETSFGANVYGGSVSFYVGSYAWSQNLRSGRSSSTCGSTTASGIRVRVQNVSSSNVRASTATTVTFANGDNSYGGSLSLMHIGAYSWSFSNATIISSMCGATSVSDLSVHVSGSTCTNCSALSSASGGYSYGANSYGGSMSVMHVGAYSWSLSNAASSTSSSSMCGATLASDVSVHVSGSTCFNCSAMSATIGLSNGANSYGGSMSLMHIGPYSWSFVSAAPSSSSMCGVTLASDVSVHVSESECRNCSAVSIFQTRNSNGGNSYGGAISAAVFGAYAHNMATGAFQSSSNASVNNTDISRLSITITNATFLDSTAWSGD